MTLKKNLVNKKPPPRSTDYFLLLIIMVDLILTGSILIFGTVQYGGHDGSVMTNHAWQLSLGYKPYQELVTYLPALFLMGCKWAFTLWGVHWTSFVSIAALYTALTFPLQAYILKRLGFGRVCSLLLAASLHCMSMVSISWWWYNHTTSIAAGLFLSAAFLFNKEPGAKSSRVIYVGTMALLSLAKPNIAGPLLILVVLLLLLLSPQRLKVLYLSLAAALLSIAVLFLHGINPVDLVSSYSLAGGRVLSVQNWLDFFYYIDQWEAKQTLFRLVPAAGALLLIAALLVTNSGRITGSAAETALCCGMAAAGILLGLVGMGTNGDHNIADAPLIILGLSFLYLRMYELAGRRTGLWNLGGGLLLASTVLLAVNGYKIGWQRLRVMSIGPGMFYEEAPLSRLDSPAFFKGMAVGPAFISCADDLTKVMNRFNLIKPDASVFFGSRLVFGYAMYGIRPQPGIPFDVWDRFSLPRVNGKNIYIERFKQARFNACLFYRRDYVYIPPEIMEYLFTEYESFDMGDITVHLLRR